MENLYNEKISVKYFVGLLIKNKLIFFITPAIFVLVAIFYVQTAKEYFQSVSKFVLNIQNRTQLPNLEVLGIATGLGNSADPSNYLDQVIKDEMFCKKLINKKWKSITGDSVSLISLWNLNLKNEPPGILYKKVIDYFRKKNYLNLVFDTRSKVMTLIVEIEDPLIAYEINKEVVIMLNEFIINSSKKRAKEKREFIEKRIEEIKIDLTSSENNLVKFKEKNVMSNTPNILIEEMRLQRVVSKNQEIYLQLISQFELTGIDEKNDQSTIELIRNPEIPVERSKPLKKIIVGFSFVTGIFISYLLILAKNYFCIGKK